MAAKTITFDQEAREAIRRGVESYPDSEDLKVAVLGTGGMSHQLQGERAGFINTPFDTAYLNRLADDAEALTKISHTELLRDAGSERIELVRRQIMRAALTRQVREVQRHTHEPASNTAAGLIIFEGSEALVSM